jgi:hypothetical protein
MNHRWTSHCLTMSSWQGVISVNKAKWWVELFVGPKAYRINSIFIHHQSDDMHYVIHTNPFWARSATLASANIGDSLPNWKRLSCPHTRLIDDFPLFSVNFRLNLPYFPTSMSVEWGDFPAATFDARHRKSRWHHTRPVWRTQNDLNLTWADEIGECMLLFLISSFKTSFILY